MANNSANYNVNMRFTADTGQAKQQLRDLQSSLDTLMNQIATKNIKFFDVNATKKEIDEASAAVQELKIALDQATNVNTGRLDLSKFSKSLSQSGYTLQDLLHTQRIQAQQVIKHLLHQHSLLLMLKFL